MDKNKGLFEKIKKSVTAGQEPTAGRTESLASSDIAKKIEQQINTHHHAINKQLENAAELARLELQQKEQLLQQEAMLEQRRLSSELESKYQQSSEIYIQRHETNLRQKFEAEKQRLQKELKEKYERIARTALQKREQEIMQHARHEITKAKSHEQELVTYAKKQQQLNNAEWQVKLNQVQQELSQQKQRFKIELDAAMHQARLEQEAASKKAYEQHIHNERCNLSSEQELALKKNLAVDLERTKDKLQAELDLELNRKLLAKEQELNSKFQDELIKNNDLHQAKLDREIDLAVASAVQETELKLHNEFARQQQQLNHELSQIKAQFAAQIEYLNHEHNQEIQTANLATSKKVSELTIELDKVQAEFAQSRSQLQQQIESSLRTEYESQINYYKSEEYQAQELSRLLEQQRKSIIKELETEQTIVLRHKQRDVETTYEAKHATTLAQMQTKFDQDLQDAIAKNAQELSEQYAVKLAEQEQLITNDCEAKLQEARATLEYATKQQALAADQITKLQQSDTTIRNELHKQYSIDTKNLLQKQQQILTQQYHQDLQHKLQDQALKLSMDYQQQLQDLEFKLQVAQSVTQIPSVDPIAVANAVAKREQELTTSFNVQMTQLQSRFEAQLAATHQNAAATIAMPIAQAQFIDNDTAAALEAQKAQLLAQFATEKATLELKFLHDKENALEQLRQEQNLTVAANAQRAKIEIEHARLNDAREQDASLQQILDTKLAAATFKREQEIRAEFEVLLKQQREEDASAIRAKLHQEMLQSLEQQKQVLHAEFKHKEAVELESAQDELNEQYAKKLQQHIEIIKTEQEQESAKLQLEFEEKLQDAITQQKLEVQESFEHKIAQLEQNKQEAIAIRIDQERKKLNLKYAQDKATLIQELSARFNQEKQAEIVAFENHLRDSLYKEMVKQKEYLQTKFANSQEIALQELKRRLDAEHKHEIERIKQGFFVRNESAEFTQTIANTRTRSTQRQARGLENLADSLLSKFQGRD